MCLISTLKYFLRYYVIYILVRKEVNNNETREKKYNKYSKSDKKRQKEKRECRAWVSGRTGWRMKRKSLPAGVYRKFHKKKGAAHVHVQPSKRVRLPDFATTDGCTDSFLGSYLDPAKNSDTHKHTCISLIHKWSGTYIQGTSEIARFL